jgi:hypothetical protein
MLEDARDRLVSLGLAIAPAMSSARNPSQAHFLLSTAGDMDTSGMVDTDVGLLLLLRSRQIPRLTEYVALGSSFSGDRPHGFRLQPDLTSLRVRQVGERTQKHFHI